MKELYFNYQINFQITKGYSTIMRWLIIVYFKYKLI